jgi:hypothetical protein
MEIAHRNYRSQDLQSIYYKFSLFKSKRLSTNIKRTLHKALIRSVITYAYPAWEFAADIYVLKLQRLQNKFSALLAIFQGTRRSANYIKPSIFRTFVIILQNYAGNKQKWYKIMEMLMSVIWGKANPEMENLRGLNLVEVKRTTVQVFRPLL